LEELEKITTRDFLLARETGGGGPASGRRRASDAFSAMFRSTTRDCALAASLRVCGDVVL